MSHKRSRTIAAGCFCSEIAGIVRSELALGNKIAQPPEQAGWPQAESVFGSLALDFRTDVEHPPAGVVYSICNDPHYGWYGEYYCEVHKHLLVAGPCRRERPGKNGR